MNAPLRKLSPRSLRFGAIQGVDWNDTLALTSTALEHGNPVTRALDLTGTFQTFVIEQGAGVAPIALGTLSGDLLIADAARGWVQIYVPGLRVASWRLGEWPFRWRLFRPGDVTQIATGTVLITDR